MTSIEPFFPGDAAPCLRPRWQLAAERPFATLHAAFTRDSVTSRALIFSAASAVNSNVLNVSCPELLPISTTGSSKMKGGHKFVANKHQREAGMALPHGETILVLQPRDFLILLGFDVHL